MTTVRAETESLDVFIMGPRERALVSAMRACAEKQAPRTASWATLPPEDSQRVGWFWGLRVVFAIADVAGQHYRQLSVALVSRRERWPSPAVVEELGCAFGFTGILLDWDIHFAEASTVLVVQPVVGASV